MSLQTSHWKITTKLFLINLLIILVVGGILTVIFISFNNIKSLVTTVVSRDVSRVVENAQLGKELTGVFADLLMGMFSGQEEDAKIKLVRFEQTIKALITGDTNPRLQASLNEFMRKLTSLIRQSAFIRNFSQKFREIENDFIYNLEMLQDIIAEKADTPGADALVTENMEQLQAMSTRYRETFFNITMQVAELRQGNAQVGEIKTGEQGEKKHPVIASLDFFYMELRTLTASDPEISDQGRQLMGVVANYKKTVHRFMHAAAEFQKLLRHVNDLKEYVMSVLMDINKQISLNVRSIRETTEGRMQLYKKITTFLSGAAFFVIFLITYSVLNTFRELKKVNRALQTAHDHLEDMNRELQRLDRLKDEFLANTSHELRTPLNGIIGIADSLIDGAVGPLTEAQRHNLSLIVSSGRRLTNLVNDILDFSKLRCHELQLRTRPLDMRSVTGVVLMLSQTLVGNREIQLVNQIEARLPAAEADEDRVQQILHNLVGNAVKFTGEGRVSVSAEVRDEYLAVTVSDTGIGIPKDRFESIFESFEQADGSTAREYGGTGLGLAVTKNLVELHGGQIRAESEIGKGSHFTFTLPVSGDKAEPLQIADILARNTRVAGISATPAEIGDIEEPDVADIPPENLCDGLQCRILAVDDEPVNLQVLRNQLTSEYYSVTLASDGREALAALESDQKFDLVLLDVMMPGMSGYEVCRHLRKTHPENELPVVMLTAKNQTDDLVAGFDSGASDYLTKPFSRQELVARIDTHITLKYLHAGRMQAETEARLLSQEMDIAKRIQTALIPEKPELPGYEIAASTEPADEVGGDYYDVISVAGHDWIVIGDVSGHGVPAGLVMMMVQTAIHTVLTGNPEMPPSRLLSVINRTIYENMEKMGESKHVTIVVLSGGKDGNFSFAGLHEDILIRRAATGKVEAVETDGMWIGLEPDISQWLSTDTLKLEPGDCMVLFTDGITEAWDRDGNLFGDERLMRIIEESGDSPASEIHKNIITALESWDKPDDVTLVVVRRCIGEQCLQQLEG